MINSTSRYCNEAETRCGTLYNFGLLYKDGDIEGQVTNLSGSSNDIDMSWVDRFTNDTSELTIRSSSGAFTQSDLTEGDFSLLLEDAGWEIPMLNSRGEPDDDGTRTGPSTVTARVRGKDASETMPTFWVYDAGASQNDNATNARVNARQDSVGAGYNRSVRWSAGWTRRSFGTETTTNPANVGTISWQSESVSLSFSRTRGATYELKNGSTACSGTRCTLSYNKTGSTKEGEDRENTLT